MDESLERSFGILIAYIVPGFVCLAGMSLFSDTVAGWMSATPTAAPSVGGFLYVTLGSLGAGLICNAFRFVILDTLHHWTGLKAPYLDFRRLQSNIDAFKLAVEHNYRFYQFHGAMILAAAFYSVADQWTRGAWSLFAMLAFLVLEGVLFVTSRDNLQRFYSRTQQLLNHQP